MNELITALERKKLEALQVLSNMVPAEIIDDHRRQVVNDILFRLEAEAESESKYADQHFCEESIDYMYYVLSQNLVANNPEHVIDIIRIDRCLAHTYEPTGFAWVNDTLLGASTALTTAEIAQYLAQYEAAGVLKSYSAVECQNQHHFDPLLTTCPICHLAMVATSSEMRYRIIVSPRILSFDPTTASGPFDVFISYRHHEAGPLAIDIYHSLTVQGWKVFLDNGVIPPGIQFEKKFLDAASQASHFIGLVSVSYFGSKYCQSELAHALRNGRNTIPVPVGCSFNPPASMPWLVHMNPCQIVGDEQGLTPELEDFLLPQIQQKPAPLNYNFQLEACGYLLEQLGESALTQVIARVTPLRNIPLRQMASGDLILAIRREVDGNTSHVRELSAALAP